MAKGKDSRLFRRVWEISPETRITPSSKIYKKKDRHFDYRDELDKDDNEDNKPPEDTED